MIKSLISKIFFCKKRNPPTLFEINKNPFSLKISKIDIISHDTIVFRFFLNLELFFRKKTNCWVLMSVSIYLYMPK